MDKTTEEEMAEEFADKTRIVDENTKAGTDCISLVQDYEGNYIDIHERIKQAYLAGFKAGRPNWHYVSKEGHPTKDDIYLIIRKGGLHLGDYCCGGDGDIDCQSWCDYPSEEEIQDDSVIAWKEIVLPKED